MDRLGQFGAAIDDRGDAPGRSRGLIDELGTLSFESSSARRTRSRARLAPGACAKATPSGSCAATIAGSSTSRSRRASSGRGCCYLNTDFGGPQLATCASARTSRCWSTTRSTNSSSAPIEPRLRPRARVDRRRRRPARHARGADRRYAGQVPPPPSEHASLVLLTSGTTGTPKGAPRAGPLARADRGAAVEGPVPRRRVDVRRAPMFHGLGFTQMALSVILGSTTICERRFKPERVLDAIARQRPTALVVVPVMLSRIVSLMEESPDVGHELAADRVLLGRAARGRARAPRAADDRRQALQLLRLDRGRVRDVRDSR